MTEPDELAADLIQRASTALARARLKGESATYILDDEVDNSLGSSADLETDLRNALDRNEIDILLISPERLANERFQTRVLAGIAARIALLVIDEAHCISDWGHDFRPHYRLLERIVRTLPQNLRLLATTATANNRVMEDLTAVLGPNMKVSRGDLNRSSLTLQTIRMRSQAERLAWLRCRRDSKP